ncbi:MAG: motility associated factor glycosyltransferase family protein [Planctomycetes bacterium]|nr:motility associated factor glycosyltransferase family protein [Planctomycetota bacterium]
MSYLEENLRILKKTRPKLARLVEEAPPLPADRLAPTKTGGVTALVDLPDGKRLLLASKYQPEEEAKRLLEGYEMGPTSTYFVLGMGMGYHVAELQRRRKPETRLVVLEADPSIFRTALANCDFAGMLSSEQVHILVGDRIAELFAELRNFVFEIFSSPIVVVPHRPSIAAARDFYRRAHHDLTEFVQGGSLTVKTALILSRASFHNRFANIVPYLSSVGVRVLYGRHRGLPGIVVSAGPSLYRNIDRLKDLEGRAVLFAVSTALKPLLARGIRPTYSVLLDFHDVSRRYFDRIDPAVAAKIPLVCDSKAAPAAVAAYDGPLVIGDDTFLDAVFKELQIQKGPLPPGSTVAHTAFHLAHICGCDPVVFVGQDLAYSYHVTHVPGTAIFNQWLPELNRFQTLDMKEWENIVRLKGALVKVKSVDGKELYTDEQMLSYRKDFELLISLGDRTYIDATEGGAYIEGTQVMPLSEVIERYAGPVRPELLDPGLPRLAPEDRREIFKGALEALELRTKEMDEMSRLYRDAIDILGRIENRIERGERVNKMIRKVHDIRTRCREFGHIYHVISNLAIADNIHRQVEDRRIRSEKLTGREKQREQTRRDLEYVRALSRGLDYLKELALEIRPEIEREAGDAAEGTVSEGRPEAGDGRAPG